MNYLAPKEQQLQGLKTVLSSVPYPTFLRALDNLVYNKFLSKSQAHKLRKQARHLLNLEWEEGERVR
jgi:hypothetical protein